MFLCWLFRIHSPKSLSHAQRWETSHGWLIAAPLPLAINPPNRSVILACPPRPTFPGSVVGLNTYKLFTTESRRGLTSFGNYTRCCGCLVPLRNGVPWFSCLNTECITQCYQGPNSQLPPLSRSLDILIQLIDNTGHSNKVPHSWCPNGLGACGASTQGAQAPWAQHFCSSQFILCAVISTGIWKDVLR